MNKKGSCPLLSFKGASKFQCIESECTWYNCEENDCILFCINQKLKKQDSSFNSLNDFLNYKYDYEIGLEHPNKNM